MSSLFTNAAVRVVADQVWRVDGQHGEPSRHGGPELVDRPLPVLYLLVLTGHRAVVEGGEVALAI